MPNATRDNEETTGNHRGVARVMKTKLHFIRFVVDFLSKLN